MELLLKNATIFGKEGLWDVAVQDGRILGVEALIEQGADTVYDLEEKLLIPGFVDIHTHLDKTLITVNPEAGLKAIRTMLKLKKA